MRRDSLLCLAARSGFAVPAFNYSDIWELLAIVEAAQEAQSPVYVASNMRVVDALGIAHTGALGRQLQADSCGMIVNHLDHSTSVELCRSAVDNGYASVMIDGSMEEIDENIRQVKAVAAYAHERGVLVEAEIGRIRGNTMEGVYTGDDYLAGVEDCVRMVRETGVDSLAVGLGNAHGFYAERPRLRFDRLAEIHEAVDIPLVLHGGTGIPYEDIQIGITMGIAKVNVGTLLHSTYLSSLRASLQKEREGYSIPDVFEEVKEAVKRDVREWIEVCMSGGKIEAYRNEQKMRVS